MPTGQKQATAVRKAGCSGPRLAAAGQSWHRDTWPWLPDAKKAAAANKQKENKPAGS
jgi:hypothetical protein